MSQNKFKIEITATDTASDVINQVQDNLERVARPINKINEAAKPIKGSLNPIQQLGQGLKNASKNLSEITRSPSISSLGSQLLRLGSNATVGAEGVAAAGAGIATGLTAGIAVLGTAAYAAVNFTNSWGKAGFALDKQSSILGMSTEDLQKWTGAARVAGVTADEMTSAIGVFGLNLRNLSRGGASGELSVAANLFGIKVAPNKPVDVNKGLMDALEKITKRTEGNPQLRMAALSDFGLQSLAPLTYEKGGIERLRQYVASLNVVKTPEQIKKAVAAQRTRTAAELATEAADYDLQAKVMTVTTPIVRLYANTIAAVGNMFGKNSSAERADNPFEIKKIGGNIPNLGVSRKEAETTEDLIKRLGAGGANTLSALIPAIYPRPFDEAGKQKSIQEASRELGISPNQQLDVNNPKILSTIISNMLRSARADKEQDVINQGANQSLKVDVHINNAPAGTTATVHQGSQRLPARVHNSMTGIPQ